ncbi:glycosyltransferase family 4 protein [bacterium]|nr:glycosyltransferase family 4 protein [bacterium]
MHVWLLKISEILPLSDDARMMRAGMLAKSLLARGHQVTWWTSAFDHMKKEMLYPEDTVVTPEPGFTLNILKGRGYSRNISIDRYLDHRQVAMKFRQMSRKADPPDIVVAAMPDHQLALEGVRYANEVGIPIVVDTRDQWPDTFLDVLPYKWLKVLAQFPLAGECAKLRAIMRNADAIVGINATLLDWALDYAGRYATPNDKVFYLGARRPIDFDLADFSPDFLDMLAKIKDKFVVTYVGTFGRNTDPYVIAQATELINKSENEANKFAFVIAGTGTSYEKVLHLSKGHDNIYVPGWVNEKQISALLSISSAGVIPCLEAFPNKAFTYMSGGLPILTSTNGDLTRMVNNEKMGLYFKPNDPTDLARCICKLKDDPALRDEMASNSLRIFNSSMNSDVIYGEYIDHIERIAAQHASKQESLTR